MKKINVDDIIKEAAKFDGWFVKEDGYIRIRRGEIDCCPITCGLFYSNPRYPVEVEKVSHQLNLSLRAVYAIMSAAENWNDSNKRLRKKLMKELGVVDLSPYIFEGQSILD